MPLRKTAVMSLQTCTRFSHPFKPSIWSWEILDLEETKPKQRFASLLCDASWRIFPVLSWGDSCSSFLLLLPSSRFFPFFIPSFLFFFLPPTFSFLSFLSPSLLWKKSHIIREAFLSMYNLPRAHKIVSALCLKLLLPSTYCVLTLRLTFFSKSAACKWFCDAIFWVMYEKDALMCSSNRSSF